MMTHRPFSVDISDHCWTPPKNSNKVTPKPRTARGSQALDASIFGHTCNCPQKLLLCGRRQCHLDTLRYMVLQYDHEDMEQTLITLTRTTQSCPLVRNPWCDTVRYGAMTTQRNQAKHCWFAGSICYLSGLNLFAAHQPSSFRSGQSDMTPPVNQINCWIPPGKFWLIKRN